MQRDRFPSEVAERLKWYVYRLIDPRNGETFYVGKGEGNRIFQHAKAALSTSGDEDATDLKLQRIKDITSAELHVAHIVHRHGIETAEVAFQIEAALIDAYPGLTNRITGHGTDDYGSRHVEQIISEYEAQEFEVKHPLILISIARSYEDEERDIYEAVRGVWRISVTRAEGFKLVLAHRRGLVLGAFRPERWLEATKTNFPWLDHDVEGRWGFEGRDAEPSIESLYKGKRVPDKYRPKGARGPIRYLEP